LKLQYLFHKFCLIPTETGYGPVRIIFIIFKDSYEDIKILSAAKKQPVSPARTGKSDYLGAAGVDDMTVSWLLVTGY
jgi:hypothetical protein